MSGSTSILLSTAAFTDAEKADVRRFCGYSNYGQGASGFQSWRFNTAYGLLEYRLNNMAPAEYQVMRQYLSQLYVLEGAIPAAAGNLDTDRAAVWYRNRDEIADRNSLFNSWRRRMVSFMGIPPGPEFGHGNTVALVV